MTTVRGHSISSLHTREWGQVDPVNSQGELIRHRCPCVKHSVPIPWLRGDHAWVCSHLRGHSRYKDSEYVGQQGL